MRKHVIFRVIGWGAGTFARGAYAAPLALGVVVAALAGTPELQRFTFTQPHMGTQIRIVLYAPDEKSAQRASDAAFLRIKQLDDCMSDYQETSELMRLCKQAGGPPSPVSADLYTVLDRAQELARLTGGAFDVTVGPISRLWRRSRRQKELPTPQRLAEALALVGHEKLILDPSKRTVQLAKPGMLLDLGGIAKGYAADEAQKVLKEHGIKSALVAAGGDIVVSDPPPGQKTWAVGIIPLTNPESPPTRTLNLANAGVSTSGDAEQYVEINGRRYSHILDPKTGLGLPGHASVTVIAPNGLTADSLDTAVVVLGPKKGMELIEGTPGVAALMLEATPQGEKAHESKNWKARAEGQK
jgi:thiamine biosynthesis lipoprotein